MSIPSWVRAAVLTAIAFLFVWQATGWAYNQAAFATKSELREKTDNLKEYMKERFDRIEKSLQKVR